MNEIRLPHLGKTVALPPGQTARELSLAWLLAAEGPGGDSRDPGGPTNYGWTLSTLLTLEPALADLNGDGAVNAADLTAMTAAQAASLYTARFWEPLGLTNLAPRLACALLDASVNLGPSRAVRLAQEAYNALPGTVKLAVDGRLGPVTRAALSAAPPGLEEGLRRLRADYYGRLAAASAAHARYLKGWLNRLADLDVFLDAAFG